MTVITTPKICKPLVNYPFYCMVLFHNQTRCHLINPVYYIQEADETFPNRDDLAIKGKDVFHSVD